MKVSIYSGCDYIENIKGLGFGTLINQADSDDSLNEYIRAVLEEYGVKVLPEGIKTIKEYVELASLTFAGFNNQLIFHKNKVMNMNELSPA